MIQRSILALTGVVAIVASSMADETKIDPRAELATAIPEAIRLLEAKEYKAFLKSFVAPEDFEKITKRTPIDEFAEQFGMQKSGDLLKVLNAIKDKTPTYDGDRTKATYEFKIEGISKTNVRFTKVENAWYILN